MTFVDEFLQRFIITKVVHASLAPVILERIAFPSLYSVFNVTQKIRLENSSRVVI